MPPDDDVFELQPVEHDPWATSPQDQQLASTMTHQGPTPPASPPIYRSPYQQVPGQVLGQIGDAILAPGRITQQTMEEGYRGQPMDEQ